MPRRKEPRIPDAVLDQLLGGADPKTAFDPNGLLDDLRDCRKVGGQAAMAAGSCGSLAAWKRCPKPVPSVPL